MFDLVVARRHSRSTAVADVDIGQRSATGLAAIEINHCPTESAPQSAREIAAMPDAANFIRHEKLRDGRLIEIRALRPDDELGMLAALEDTSAQSLQRRFFVTKRHFSERERAFFMEPDFRNHVALVACTEVEGRSTIIGGGRYVMFEPGRAEMAFVVIDAWQGCGIGGLLTCHLIAIAREAGLTELTAEVLSDNAAMLRVFGKFGFTPATTRDPSVIHMALNLT
jgi:ribosomal protein S18 acetylase RimI-like enzyme